MKYFTRDLMERFGSHDQAVASVANDEWEDVLNRYDRRLQEIDPELPEHIRMFSNLLLHDASVLGIARREEKLIMMLWKDIPPRDLVILTYTLLDEPFLDQEALSPESRCKVMEFMYDEFDLIREGDEIVYTQSILFSNGWEMRLRFRDVQVALADPVYPLSRTMLAPVQRGDCTPLAAVLSVQSSNG